MVFSLKCNLCGIEFESKSNSRKVCSKKCYDSHPRGSRVSISMNCIECKKLITVTPKRLESGRGQFCSKECRSNNKKFNFICSHCGKKCVDYISRSDRKKYCSKKCQVQHVLIDNKKIGSAHYNYQGALHANTYRREAFAIYGEKCSKCKSTENIQVHHIDHNRRNNPQDGSNWEVLCLDCHWEYHGKIKGFLSNPRVIVCPHCSNSFIARNKHTKFCSRNCALIYRHKKNRESTYTHRP